MQKNNTSNDAVERVEIIEDDHLMGLVFILYLLMQISWVLRPPCTC